MAKELIVRITGDPRNPSGPCIAHAYLNARSFFGDTVPFYGEDDQGHLITLHLRVGSLKWSEEGGSTRWEIRGHADDKRPCTGTYDIETKQGEIRCGQPKSHRGHYLDA